MKELGTTQKCQLDVSRMDRVDEKRLGYNGSLLWPQRTTDSTVVLGTSSRPGARCCSELSSILILLGSSQKLWAFWQETTRLSLSISRRLYVDVFPLSTSTRP